MKKLTTLLVAIFAVVFLVACQSKYKVDVELTSEEIREVKADIKQMKQLIEDYDDSKEEYALSIPYEPIIQLARDYEKLGNLGKAIDLYKSYLDQGYKTKSMINNLGRLYEQIGEYDLAVEQYLRLVNEYFETRYLYDITWAYIRAKDRKNAEKFFNAWQLEFQRTDEQTQQALKKLREAEKAN